MNYAVMQDCKINKGEKWIIDNFGQEWGLNPYLI